MPFAGRRLPSQANNDLPPTTHTPGIVPLTEGGRMGCWRHAAAKRRRGRTVLSASLSIGGLLVIAACGGTGDQGSEPDPRTSTPTSAKPTATFQFANSQGFRYRYAATGATFDPTGDPADPTDPASPGTNYIVVTGTLDNLTGDRPAPMYPDSGEYLAVTVPIDEVRKVVPANSAIKGKSCSAITTPLAKVNAEDAANQPGTCIFGLDPSIRNEDDSATVPANGSAEVTYTALLPDPLPKSTMRLVIATNTGEITSPGITVSQAQHLP
jgi:hypothetical protein